MTEGTKNTILYCIFKTFNLLQPVVESNQKLVMPSTAHITSLGFAFIEHVFQCQKTKKNHTHSEFGSYRDAFPLHVLVHQNNKLVHQHNALVPSCLKDITKLYGPIF